MVFCGWSWKELGFVEFFGDDKYLQEFLKNESTHQRKFSPTLYHLRTLIVCKAHRKFELQQKYLNLDGFAGGAGIFLGLWDSSAIVGCSDLHPGRLHNQDDNRTLNNRLSERNK
jgi:hypothetical protein